MYHAFLSSSLALLALSAQSVQVQPAGPHRPFPHGGQSPQPVPELTLPRGTLDVRVEPGQGSAGAGGWITTQAHTFVNVPRASATFVAAQDDTNLAASFSAEASTSASDKRLFVRALVDGIVAAPSDVVFTEGSFQGARSFTFTAQVDRGVHTVEIQWLVDAGGTASLRAQALELRHGLDGDAGGSVTHHTPPSGDEDRTTVSSFVPVPGGSVTFHSPSGMQPVITFCAETNVLGTNKRLFVRALVDGVVCAPSDVVFAQRNSRQSHSMSFRAPALLAGAHVASIEWLVDAGGVGSLGDRTLLVTGMRNSSASNGSSERLIVAPSGPAVSTSSSTWAQIPDLSLLTALPPNAEISVGFSGEVNATTSARLEMRLVAPGTSGGEVAVLAQQGFPFECQSFTFDSKHVFQSSTTLTGMWLEWRAIGGLVSMGDRAMHVTIESGLVPDLAEAPEIGLGSSAYPAGQPVEAAIGTRKVLTLIHRIARAAPNNVIPTVAQVQSTLYGAHGMADYYDAVSGGRFHLANAGVLAFDALKTEDHYWNHAPFNCGMPGADGFAGGHAERWTEVVQSAAASVDFASFDTNGDGVLSPETELAILIVVPQQSSAGFTRDLDPFCSGAAVTVDGVVVPRICEWFTGTPANNWEVPTHELAHLILGLSDLYANAFNFDTEAGSLSLMGDNVGNTTHLDAFHKLALGWATPWYTPVDGPYALQDVKESGAVVVLPRSSDGDGQECFVLETRVGSNSNPLYDEDMNANGVIVWHIVESPAQNATPPGCMTALEWNSVSGNGRRALRLLRPGVDFASSSNSDWNASNYDLFDNGLQCPGLPATRNALRWADGGASGWSLLGWSIGGPLMSFDVQHD